VSIAFFTSREVSTAASPAGGSLSQPPILAVEGLRISFDDVDVVRGIDFSLARGEILGLVGESGSGKTLTGLSLVGLLPDAAQAQGSVRFDDVDLLALSEVEMNRLRGRRIGVIFQDAMRALNPMLSIRTQLTEGIRYHLRLKRDDAVERALEWLRAMGIPDPAKRLNDYPHQLSGGMRQRVMAAVALACEPDVLIADEPTTAVDVTAQAEILALLREQVAKLNSAMLFITHDLGSLASLCDRVAVMYAGRIVEGGDAEAVFSRPTHPYTLGLLRTVPRLEAIDQGREFESIPGQPPLPTALPEGCAFNPRCAYAIERCRREEPSLRPIAGGGVSACHRAEEVAATSSHD
jgi:oligopeptide/dipeptide ABC transporter ATP-binding protein